MVENGGMRVWDTMSAHEVEVGTEALSRPARNSVGGWPFLDDGQEWPVCFCDERMSLFFQLDIPESTGPFSQEHLLVFHCRIHSDATYPQLAGEQLIAQYWDAAFLSYPRPFWRVLLQRSAELPHAEAEPSVRALPLTLRSFDDAPDGRGLGTQRFKVSGTPSWAQGPELYRCACGADLEYLCQVPEDMDFAVQPGQPVQPDSIRDETYQLFLGNEVYLLACPEHCDPAAVWPVNQN